MSMIIRVDDFPGTKPEEFWRHNLDNFKRFDDVMHKHDLDYTLGVIPRYTTEEHIKWLTANPWIHVALHGRYHDERFPNEFRDHETEQDVYQAILSAKAPLEGCNPLGIEIYIPPHNVIDRKTVNALHRAGIQSIWGGPGSDPAVLEYARSKGMDTIYFTDPLEYGRSDELLQRNAQVFLREQKRCLCLHWTWEWNIGLESLDRFLTELGDVG